MISTPEPTLTKKSPGAAFLIRPTGVEYVHVETAGTPRRIRTQDQAFRQLLIVGNNAERTANTGNIYIGTDQDNQPWVIAPGETFSISSPPGTVYSLRDLWVDADTDGDGAAMLLWPDIALQ